MQENHNDDLFDDNAFGRPDEKDEKASPSVGTGETGETKKTEGASPARSDIRDPDNERPIGADYFSSVPYPDTKIVSDGRADDPAGSKSGIGAENRSETPQKASNEEDGQSGRENYFNYYGTAARENAPDGRETTGGNACNGQTAGNSRDRGNGQNPYGGQNPYAGQNPYGGQNPYAGQNPYGGQNNYRNYGKGEGTLYGGTNPYASAQGEPVPDDFRPVSGAGRVLGIVSMVCGILSVLGCCCMGVFLAAAIAGIITSAISFKRGDRNGFAVAGLVTSIVGVVFNVIVIIAIAVTGSAFPPDTSEPSEPESDIIVGAITYGIEWLKVAFMKT